MGSPLLLPLLLALAPAPPEPTELPSEVATSPGAVHLAPVSEWGIDYDEQQCRLRRLFGSEQQPHLLSIEQSAPISTFALTIAGKQLPDLDGRIFIQLGLEGDQPMKVPQLRLGGTLAGFGPAVIWPFISLHTPEKEPRDDERVPIQPGINLSNSRKIGQIVVRSKKEVFVLETGNMQPAIRALNACTVDLLTSWGLDAGQHRYFTPPQLQNADIVYRRMTDDGRGEERSQTDQGVFEFRVIVEIDGSVSDCVQLNATNLNSLKPRLCTLMRSARFDPARDAEGKPMRSFASGRYSIYKTR